jgi:predicted oxidoreductase
MSLDAAGGARVDVIVIGSGIAGLSAALEAAERGASVAVLEGGSTIGGASVMSGAACCLVGTPEQEAAGIRDSVELALSDWAQFGGPTADLEWAAAYLRDSRPDVHDWCESLGIKWGSPRYAEGNSVPRWHVPDGWGPGIVGAVLGRLRRMDVPIIANATVVQILAGRSGVSGVRVTGSAELGHLDAGAVIVATGGFVNNREMLERAKPSLFEYSRVLQGGSPTAQGTGHMLLESLGAEFTAMGNVWVYPTGTPDPQDNSGRRGLGLRGATTEVWLNLHGDRFHDESQRGGHSGTNALLGQDGGTIWSVFDASEVPNILLIDNEFYATPAGPHPAAMETFWRDSAHVVRASDPVELARAAGLPEAAVTRSIEEFNYAIASGAVCDPATGRILEGLSQIGDGGFVAVQLFPMAQKNLGGVRTDLRCRVLDRLGVPLPGIYAAGELAGMAGGSINGAAGLEGTMFGPSLYSGRIAGKSVEF